MKKKLAALRQSRGKQIEVMEANVTCSNEQQTKAYNDAKAEVVRLDGEIAELDQIISQATPLVNVSAIEPDAAKLAAENAELSRKLEITNLGNKYNLAKLAAEHIEKKSTVEQFRAVALDVIAARETETRNQISITRDQVETRRNLAEAAILHSVNPTKFTVDVQNDFRGMRVSRLAEELLVRSGVSVRGKTLAEIANLTMHATADFPYILENVGRKLLLAAYDYAQPTYRVWAKPSTTPDFKAMSRLRLSETPSFIVVPEGAQITLGVMTESKETYAIATYGRGVSFTRQMLINDDLGAFNDLLRAFGVQAARLENKTVYAILNLNAAMADTIALFFATHYNLGTGVIGNTALDAAFTAMGSQKGLDGSTVLNLVPKYFIVPLAKASTAQNAMTASGNNLKPSDQNWFAGRMTVVADGELDPTSTAVWYLAADPGVAPGVEYCHLEGATGPQIIRKENEGAILGVQLYAYLDFGAKAVDWRPLYKSSGA